MSRLQDSAVRLVNLFRRERLERELDAELQAYLELDVEENIRRGMAPKEARRTALTRLGGVEMVKEECRDVQRFRVAEDLWRDLRYGFRRLLARPILAVVAVAVLAIGIGANVAILALVDALLLAQASRAGRRPGRTEPPRGDRTPGRSGVAAGGKCARRPPPRELSRSTPARAMLEISSTTTGCTGTGCRRHRRAPDTGH